MPRNSTTTNTDFQTQNSQQIAGEIQKAVATTSLPNKRTVGKRSSASMDSTSSIVWNIEYQQEETVLVHSKWGWEQGIIRMEDKGKHPERPYQTVKCFLIHYPGWGKRYDEWVMKDSLMKLTPANEKIAYAENQERAGKDKKKHVDQKEPVTKKAKVTHVAQEVVNAKLKSRNSLSVKRQQLSSASKDVKTTKPTQSRSTISVPSSRSVSRRSSRIPAKNEVLNQSSVPLKISAATALLTRNPRGQSSVANTKQNSARPENPVTEHSNPEFDINADVKIIGQGQLRKAKIIKKQVVTRYLVQYAVGGKGEEAWVTADMIVAATPENEPMTQSHRGRSSRKN